MRFPSVVPYKYYCSMWVSPVNSVGVLFSVCSKLRMFTNYVLGPGNVHFDYGQDVYFIKPSSESPSQTGMVGDGERRLVVFQVFPNLVFVRFPYLLFILFKSNKLCNPCSVVQCSVVPCRAVPCRVVSCRIV